MLLRTIARLGLTAVVAAAPAIVATAPARAGAIPLEDLRTPVRYEAMTGPGPSTHKFASVECADPLQSVFAVGARVVGGDGHVVLTSVVPGPHLNGAAATATARGGFTGDWALIVHAVCDMSSSPPTRVDEPADGAMSVAATCPGAGRLTGVGFRLAGPVQGLGVNEVAIGPELRAVRVGLGGSGTPEELTAYGICRPVSVDERPPRTLVSNTETVEGWPASATVGESIEDMTVSAVGASVSGPGDPFLTALVPYPILGQAMVEAAGGPAQVAFLADGGDDEDDGELSVTAMLIGTFH